MHFIEKICKISPLAERAANEKNQNQTKKMIDEKLTNDCMRAIFDKFLEIKDIIAEEYNINFSADTYLYESASITIRNRDMKRVFCHKWQHGDNKDTFIAALTMRLSAHPELLKK